MVRYKVCEKGVVFSVYLDKSLVNHIKSIARQISVKERRYVSASEVVKSSLELTYPYPKQMSLIKKERKKLKKIPDQLEMI